MLVSEKHKFVYFAPKKTGSTSVRTLMQENYGAEIWRDYPDPKFGQFGDMKVSPDWRSEGPDWKHVCHMPKRFANYFKFATVRNPFSLEKSRYKHDMRHQYLAPNTTFAQFVKRLRRAEVLPTLFRKLHQEPGYKPIAGCVPFKLDAIVRIEHAQDDLEKLPFFKKGMKVGHLHKDTRIPEPEYKIAPFRIVKKYYQEDFEAFGYTIFKYVPLEILIL